VIETVHSNEKDIIYGKSKPYFCGFVKRPLDPSGSSDESRLSSERTGQIKFGQKLNGKHLLCWGDPENEEDCHEDVARRDSDDPGRLSDDIKSLEIE
jgi:hypothetical protein